jgi:hypothetical protein
VGEARVLSRDFGEQRTAIKLSAKGRRIVGFGGDEATRKGEDEGGGE